MKRLVGALAFVAVTAGAASSAMAQEIQLRGPLAGASACRRCVLYRANRFSIAPTFGITLQDEFDRVMFLGAQANYHITDGIAIGAYFGYGLVHIDTALTNQITERLTNAAPTPNIPDGSRFRQQVGRMNWMLAPQVTFIPLRGKLALFQNIFIDTDFYVFGGAAFVGVTERRDFNSADVSPSNPRFTGNEPEVRDNQIARASRVAITGTFGVGLNFYINRFLSFGVEYRAFPFAWNTMGTDENSTVRACGANGMQACTGFPDYQVSTDGRFVIDSNDRGFKFNQMINFALTVFLPTAPRIGE